MTGSSNRAVVRSLPERRLETIVGRHRFVTEHTGLGPTPPDLFVASLAACIAVYVGSYCRTAGLDATGLEVDLAFDRDETRLSGFRATVRLPKAVVGSRIAAIERVAHACLIHETVRSFAGCGITIVDATAAAA